MVRIVSLLLLLAAGGCQTAPTEVAAGPSNGPESRATAMPESLRCRQAADCVPESACYWGTPACVAAASATPEKCGDDADPVDAAHPAVTCDCFEGQCTPRATN
jgi:hypothetical protein